MKTQPICQHKWEPLYVFKSTDGKRLLQQRCKKCGKSEYVEVEENDQNDQNGSEKKEEA